MRKISLPLCSSKVLVFTRILLKSIVPVFLEIIDPRETTTIVTPKSIAVDTVMHFVRGRYNAKDSSLDALHHVANGRIETLQFQIKENNKIAGKKLSELEIC